MKFIDVITYDGTNERDLWSWLGEYYIASEDIKDSIDSEPYTSVKIMTIAGEKWIRPGQIIGRNKDNGIELIKENVLNDDLLIKQ